MNVYLSPLCIFAPALRIGFSLRLRNLHATAHSISDYKLKVYTSIIVGGDLGLDSLPYTTKCAWSALAHPRQPWNGSKRCEMGFVGDNCPSGAAAGSQLKHPTESEIAVSLSWLAENLLCAHFFLPFRIFVETVFTLSAASAPLCSSMSPCCHCSIYT